MIGHAAPEISVSLRSYIHSYYGQRYEEFREYDMFEDFRLLTELYSFLCNIVQKLIELQKVCLFASTYGVIFILIYKKDLKEFV